MAWSLMNHMAAQSVTTLLDEHEEQFGALHDRKKAEGIIHAALWLCASRPDSTAAAYAWMKLMEVLGIKRWFFSEERLEEWCRRRADTPANEPGGPDA